MLLLAKRVGCAVMVAVSISVVCAQGADMDASDVFSNPRMLEAARAVEEGDTARLTALVRSGLNVNERGKQGATLVVWAMKSLKKNSLRTLLLLKADPNLALDNKDSPVTMAAGAPDPEILKILLEGGANPNARNRLGDPAVTEALDRSLWRNFELLVAHGADLNATDRAGSTLLARLAQVNQFLDVERLLDRGIDINKPNRRGRTLAWYIERSPVDPQTDQGMARERIRVVLKQRGAI